MVQGFKTEAERDALAKAVFADILDAGAAPSPVVEPEYSGTWPTEIDAKVAEIE